MSGDQLSIRLFLLGSALSLGTAAMSAAGWNNPFLICALFASGALLFFAALFWPAVVMRVKFVSRFGSFVDRNVGLKFVMWGACILAFFPSIYFTVQAAQRQSQQAVLNGGAGKEVSEPLTGTPVQKAYKGDFVKYLRVFDAIQFDGNGGQTKLLGNRQIIYDFDGNSKFLAIYIPQTDLIYNLCVGISNNIPNLLKQGNVASIKRQDDGDANVFRTSDLKFSGAVYLYMESGLDIEQMAALIKIFKERGTTVRFRDYSNTRK